MIIVLGALAAAAAAAIPAFTLPQAAATVVSTLKKAKEASAAAEAEASATLAWVCRVNEEMLKEPLLQEKKQVDAILGMTDELPTLRQSGQLLGSSVPQLQEFLPTVFLLATANEFAAYTRARNANDAVLAGQLLRRLAIWGGKREQVFGD